MRMKSVVLIGLVAVLGAACKKDAKETSGAPGAGSAVGSAGGSAAGSGAPTPPTAGAVTLTYKVDRVGATYTETETQAMQLAIEAQGQKATMVQDVNKTKQVEVLATSPEAVTKAKITYAAILEKQTMNGTGEAKPAPHAGKTYILEADASGAVKVTAADGAPVSADEEAAVKDEEASFGEPEKMGKALDGLSFELGKRVEVPAERARAAFGEDADMVIDALALTLTKVEGDDAWFTLEVVASGEPGKGGMMKMALKGPVHLDLTTSRPLAMTLDGTIEMTGAATATGTMQMAGTRTKG